MTEQTLTLEITSPPPGSVGVGQSFGLTVAVKDSQGHLFTAFNGDVTVILSANPGSASLAGAVTVAAVNGVATFGGLSINKAGDGYAIEASSGGTSSGAAPINVIGSTTSHGSGPPSGGGGSAPVPPQVIGLPVPVKSKKGITAISVAFDEALNPSSASNLSLYHVFKGVKKKKKLVFNRPLKIKTVSYLGSSSSVSISLAKPFKGQMEVVVDGAIEAPGRHDRQLRLLDDHQVSRARRPLGVPVPQTPITVP